MGNAFPHDNKDCIVTTDSSQYLKVIFIINQNGHGFAASAGRVFITATFPEKSMLEMASVTMAEAFSSARSIPEYCPG